MILKNVVVVGTLHRGGNLVWVLKIAPERVKGLGQRVDEVLVSSIASLDIYIRLLIHYLLVSGMYS